MMKGSYCKEDSFDLLKQLEHILECDPLIDEVGFIHPSQLVALNEDADGSLLTSVNCISRSEDEILGRFTSELDNLQHKNTNFWSRDHKLAISMEVLLPLYVAARDAFMFALRQYNMLSKLPVEADRFINETMPTCSSVSEDFLESEVMRHSKALLLLSCDFGTAWNSRYGEQLRGFASSRKQVVSKKQSIPMFMNELLLSMLVLSYSPKSEHAWSHRKWVIKTIAKNCPNLQEIVENESRLLEEIAEKSKMNYRAWNHRCWLASYMKSAQVLDELNKSRKWAALHVADNCCFHYRRRLMLKVLGDSCSKPDTFECSLHMHDLYRVWKEEFDWNEMLIKHYVGREALWLHRRFLSKCWVMHFATNFGGAVFCYKDLSGINHDMVTFIDHELQLLQSCLTVLDNEFGDGKAQAVLAAAYILWVSKQVPESRGFELQEKLREVGDMKSLLSNICPEKNLLWDGLIC